MEFDNAWCPTCARQIQPKRFTISVPVQQPPPPPPPSPRRAIKQKQGFVNGTGRLRHNGTIKQQPIVQMKKRTIIDQGPIPLYCSDECQLADLSATRSGPPLDPARDEPMSTAAPIKPSNFSTTSSETESDESTSFSPGPTSSIAKLAKLYNFPPLPPPPPTFDDPEAFVPTREYTSGIMMAGRLINSLCPPPAKPHVGPHRPPPETRKPVPGWTDGSNAWRATVYSFSSPQYSSNPFYREESNKAYGSITASPHRAPRASSSSALSDIPAPPSQRSSSDEMIAKFSQSFQRRSDSRTSLHPPTPTPASPTSTQSVSQSPTRRERALLPRGMEGKLLVPNVKLKVHSSSSTSLSSAWSGPTSGSSARSPLSVTSDSEEEALVQPIDTASSLPGCRKRPTVETRSWSYDNFKTYPVMQLPPKKVKQMQKQIIDGEEREVEVEVEVVEERKRLFIFAPSLQVSQ
ncbi:hypothetical protein BYT27DRAFT_7100236 [Phlegmacium glaucopus]|nr:hypothetical protein BYT27DRAFT_7100236 [Phlegmacium glaucopus]